MASRALGVRPWALGLQAFSCLALLGAGGTARAAEPAKPLVIKAAKILTVTKGEIDNGVLVIRDGKIAAIGKQGEVAIPADAEVWDLKDRWIMPGQIDLHNHIGNTSGLHDYVHTLNPELRVWDFVDPDAPLVADAIASGITTVMTIPGSGGNHSGFGVLWKLGGAPREQLIVRKLGGMKIAQAYNPERQAGDLGRSRMGMWWMLREMFGRAKEYDANMTAWEQAQQPSRFASAGPTAATANKAIASKNPPKRQPALDNLREVMHKRTPVFVHTASARDVYQTMRMFHDDMNLPVVISHGEFGGFKVAEEAAKRNVPVNVGPRLYDFASLVYDRRFYSIPGKYAEAGVKNVSLNTDCPVIPGEDLFLQGTLSVRLGMEEADALKALTINPATAIGIGDRVGSIEVGKDADIIIKRGSLFDPRHPIERVLINGNMVYEHGKTKRPAGGGRGRFAAEGHHDDDCCQGEHHLEGVSGDR
jgi:imidazolonepropionase-like amidohydrolase